MSIGLWIVICVVVMALWLWIVLWGGADRVEGSFVMDWLHPLSSDMDAEAIKLMGWVVILATSAWFVLGLLFPLTRFWWVGNQ